MKYRATIAPIMIRMPHPKIFNIPWLLFRIVLYEFPVVALEPVSNKIINYGIPDYSNVTILSINF